MKESHGLKRNRGEKMKVIGLTGGTGSGKSIVSSWLRNYGFAVIDADAIAHEIIEKEKPAYQELVAHFGYEILDDSGNIIRKKLGSIVFSDEKQLLFLNECTHKYIIKEIENSIQQYTQQQNCHSIVLDAPLLLEVGLEQYCDEVWVVYTKEEIRLQRIMERDGLSKEDAWNRIASQKPWEEYEKAADVVIDNNGNIEYLENQLKEFLSAIY